jgi:methylmalonyl-CoA carboxyltransferase large subunit
MSNDALEKLIIDLQAEVAALRERLARLEGLEQAASAPVEAPAEPEAVAPVEEEAIPEDVLLAISAAVAAYLGERAHVRAVRLISTSRWLQEGRVSIQASHHLQRG